MASWASRVLGPALAVGTAFAALPASADAIDGDWCLADKVRRAVGHLSIAGPRIVTPAGNAIQGQYSRHRFSYVVPGDEPEAGATVSMVLLNEQTMNLRIGQGPVQVWQRCTAEISALALPRTELLVARL